MCEDVSLYEEEAFCLTEKGEAFSKQMFDRLNDNQRKLLSAFKTKLGTAPLRGILRYVYQTYPDQTINSKIKNEVLG